MASNPSAPSQPPEPIAAPQDSSPKARATRAKARKLLFEAIVNNDPKLAARALAQGATANDRQDKEGDTAFLLSLRRGRLEIAEALWPMADPLALGDNAQTFLMLAVTNKSELWARRALAAGDPKALDAAGRDALRVAAELGYTDMTALILPLSDPDRVEASGQSALRVAIARGSQSSARLIVLASKNLDRHERENPLDFHYPSLLQLAAEFGRFEIFELLQTLGVRQGLARDGKTPLMIAASRGLCDFVERVLPQSDPLAVDSAGRDALKLAIEARSLSCCAALLPVSDFERKDPLGRDALAVAKAERGLGREELAMWLSAQIESILLDRQSSPARSPTPAPRRL